MASRAAQESPKLVDLESSSSEPFRGLRLAIDLRPKPSRSNTVLFTSPSPGDGKSVIAANYALVAANGGNRVLLIDADLRRPTAHRTFQVDRSPGLSEMLRKGLEIDGVWRQTRAAPDLMIAPAGAPLPRSSDFLESPAMARALDRAHHAFDLVVIDSPPVVGLADAANLASHPGVEVVVVTDAKGRRRQLQKAFRSLEYMGATVLGTVVNRTGDLNSYEYDT